MREIKFRTWSKVAQQIISWEELKPKFIKLLDNPEYPYMQFTGLLDKNRKEIYEDDKVSIPYIDPMGRLHRDDMAYEGVIKF